MTDKVTEAKLVTKLGANGRILFPAYIRKALDLENGGKVQVELKDQTLTISKDNHSPEEEETKNQI